jgi:ATP-dependent RNA helicase DDX60
VRFDDDFEEQIDEFIAKLSDILRYAMEDAKWTDLLTSKEAQRDAVDLIDGRLFRVVIQAMCDNSLKDALPLAARNDWSYLSHLVMQLADEELSMQGSTEPESSETSASKSDFEQPQEDLAVLPFSHPIFDKHLECIHVETDTSLPARLGSMKLYRETTHWHNHKKPLTTKAPVAQKVSKWRYVSTLKIPLYAV